MKFYGYEVQNNVRKKYFILHEYENFYFYIYLFLKYLFLIYSGYKLYRIDKQNCNNELVKKIKETVIIFIVQVCEIK